MQFKDLRLCQAFSKKGTKGPFWCGYEPEVQKSSTKTNNGDSSGRIYTTFSSWTLKFLKRQSYGNTPDHRIAW